MKDIMPSAVTISIFALLFTSMVFQSAFAQEHHEDKLSKFAPTPSESLPSIVEKKFLKEFASSPSKSLPETIVEEFHKKFASSPSPSESKHGGEKKKHLDLLPFPKFFKSLPPLPSFSSLPPKASELENKKHFFGAASPASSPTSTYKPHFKVVAEPKNKGRKLL